MPFVSFCLALTPIVVVVVVMIEGMIMIEGVVVVAVARVFFLYPVVINAVLLRTTYFLDLSD